MPSADCMARALAVDSERPVQLETEPAGDSRGTRLEEILLGDLILDELIVAVGESEIGQQPLVQVGPVDGRPCTQTHLLQFVMG